MPGAARRSTMAASDFQREFLARGESQIALAFAPWRSRPRIRWPRRLTSPARATHTAGTSQIGPQQRRNRRSTAQISRPPMVGVPAFFWCDCGPSSRMCWPIWNSRSRAMNHGPNRTKISHRGQARHRRAKRRVLKNAKWREIVEQVFVSEPVEHGSASPAFLRGEKLLQGALHVNAARALEQDRITGLRERAHQLAGCGRDRRKKMRRRPVGRIAWLRPTCNRPRRVVQRAHQFRTPLRSCLRRDEAAQPSGRVRASPPEPRSGGAPEYRAAPRAWPAPRLDWSCSNR